MNGRLQAKRLVGSALLAFLAIQFVPSQAMAAKEKFQRTKPHVNVGTIGNASENTNKLTTGSGGNAATTTEGDCEPDPAKATETRPAC